ncbi:MAG: S53 family peptidase [Streptosporangiaceae bacterium]|nr:S53 family peptidase [Streptosporangiaceae bacterium]
MRTSFQRAVAIAVAILFTGAVVPGTVASASPGASNTTAGPVSNCLTLASPTCYSPRQYRTAYGIQPLTDRGITGRGQSVVLLELAAVPGEAGLTDVRQDLGRFDSVFGLPAVNLQVNTSLAPGASPFQASSEYFGDIEFVHAVAPQAAVRVVLVPQAQGQVATLTTEFAAALRLASSLGGVISVSAGLNENSFTPAEAATLHSALRFDTDRHVTVIFASGDSGAAGTSLTGTFTKGVDLPACDPLALGVGGTSLDASHTTGDYIGETVWNRPGSGIPGVVASGGGFSDDFARPAYQDGVPGIGAHRGVPDVASDADLDTGMAIVVVVDGKFIIGQSGGTSVGAPTWAGIVAMADQYAGRHLGFINPAIYQIGRGDQYHHAFHDITQGNNTVQFGSVTIQGFDATTGWDPVTGWGSPDAQVLVPLLARDVTR